MKAEVRRPKREIRVIDARRRAILGAFGFNPFPTRLSYGMHSADILGTAPRTFRRLLCGSHRDYNPAIIIKSLCCSLKSMGYMHEAGLEKRVWVNRDPFARDATPKEYNAPIWALTESGYSWLLSQCDWQHAYDLQKGSYRKLPIPEQLIHEVRFQRFTGLDVGRTSGGYHEADDEED